MPLRIWAYAAHRWGHVNGEVPSSSKYDPFWAMVDTLQVPVFVHPQRSEYFVDPESFDGRGDLANIIRNPLETTMFLSRLMFDGTFDRHPGMKVVAAHGGGFLPRIPGDRPWSVILVQMQTAPTLKTQGII